MVFVGRSFIVAGINPDRGERFDDGIVSEVKDFEARGPKLGQCVGCVVTRKDAPEERGTETMLLGDGQDGPLNLLGFVL